MLWEKVTIAGTMCHDRKSITKEIKAVNNREEKLPMLLYDKKTPKGYGCVVHRQEKDRK